MLDRKQRPIGGGDNIKNYNKNNGIGIYVLESDGSS
jgi:hypothetical protein